MLRAGEGAAGTDHLWAKAAELERDFAGYKRRLAERRAQHAAVAEAGGGEERAGDADAGRGRRYEEYVRRRDERRRQEWHARMERKEAEVQALWARLERTGSRGSSRRGGAGDDHVRDGGELAAATTGHAREDQVKPPQKPGNLAVKVKPSTPVTLRNSIPGHPPPPPAAKLARPRASVPPSLAAGSPSPRLSTPDPRRRPSSHLHRVQPQPPATPRKENRLLPPPPPAAAASPATPRPRTTAMLSRSRSMFNKDRGCSSVAVGGGSPRPPRFQFQPPRSSYDGASVSSNLKEPTPSPPRADDAIALARSSSCSREQSVVADRKKPSAVAPEPFLVSRSSGNDIEATSAPLVASKERDLPYSSDTITPAGCGNADNKSNKQENVDQSSDKFGSEEITGDSDTEPSYVYIKNKDTDDQIPKRPPQASAVVGTCPGPEPRSDTDNKDDSDNVEDAMESTGSNEVAGETPTADADEEELRRESSESLYSNVQSSFSPRSELDTSATGGSPHPSATERSPESNTSPWTGKKSTEVDDAEKRPPTPTTPRTPRDAVNGLRRLLTFGKRNGKASEAAPAAVDDGSSVSRECPAGRSAKLTVDSSDDLDSSYVISPHVGSLQSNGPSYSASSELKEPVVHAKSPRVHRSFFSFSSFKSRAN